MATQAPRQDDDGWTLRSIHAHFTQRIADLEKLLQEGARAARTAVDAALAAAKEAVGKAEQFTVEKLTAHNDLQAKLDRQAQTLATKEWVQDQLNALGKEVRAVEDRLARGEDRKAGMSLGVKILVGVVGFLGTVAGLVLAVAAIWALLHR